MIPRKIHYVWVGGPIPPKVRQIIDRNSEVLKGYEIMIWTEENMPSLNAFAQRAYEDQKWAFVSDYIRFYILYHHGGIYLDTDVEVLKPFDDLLLQDFIAGWDKREVYIHTFIVGAVSRHPLLKEVLSFYEVLQPGVYPTSPEVLTLCYRNFEQRNDLVILPSKYLSPLEEGEKAGPETFEQAYTNHLWEESWRSYVPLRRFLRRVGLMKLYHRMLFPLKHMFRNIKKQ